MTRTPRITLCRDKDDNFQLWMNPEGRNLLVKELLSLSATSDHVHVEPAYMDPELAFRTVPYQADEIVLSWGKILFRLDEWDETHFPHVMTETERPYIDVPETDEQ
jgi:hypothetical protein